jgi:hypothetical protein
MIDPLAAIYASMAVGLFGPDEPILFGKLSRSLFTMFQVLRNFELTSMLRRHLSRGAAPGADLCKSLSVFSSPNSLGTLALIVDGRTAHNRFARATRGRAASREACSTTAASCNPCRESLPGLRCIRGDWRLPARHAMPTDS